MAFNPSESDQNQENFSNEELMRFAIESTLFLPAQISKLRELVEQYPKMRKRLVEAINILKKDKSYAQILLESIRTDLESLMQ